MSTSDALMRYHVAFYCGDGGLCGAASVQGRSFHEAALKVTSEPLVSDGPAEALAVVVSDAYGIVRRYYRSSQRSKE